MIKKVIFIFAALALGCEAQLQTPEESQLLNPGFLRVISEAHQVAYHTLQTDIDQKIADINAMIAEVLAQVTSPTVGVYSTHANQVWNVYTSNNAEINTLTLDDCKENAFDGNDYAITSTGFRSVNCITGYNKKVKNESDAVNDKLREITIGFDDVALNVIRAYLPPNNPMVNGENIEAIINGTYASTVNNWNAVRPDIAAMRTSFVNNLNAFGTTLQTCFTNANNYMQTMSDLLRTQVEECVEYNGSRRELFIASLKKTLTERAEAFEAFNFDE